MKTLIVVGLAALSGAMTAPAHADPATVRPVTVGAFTAVHASAGLTVTITTGSLSVALEGDPALFDRVKVEVHDGVLRLSRATGPSWHWGLWQNEVWVRVSAPTLAAVQASSGADVFVRGIDANALALTASSGGDLTIDGTCNALVATASSGADVRAAKLICKSAIGKASSGGDVDMFATVSAGGAASSGGDVRINGPAHIGDTSESSGGDVTIKR